MDNTILVSDWEKVEKDDFYFSREWEVKEDNVKQARKLQKENNLFIAYLVDAVSYAIYSQMDAQQVLIDRDANIVLHCESAVIGNSHQHREKIDL